LKCAVGFEAAPSKWVPVERLIVRGAKHVRVRPIERRYDDRFVRCRFRARDVRHLKLLLCCDERRHWRSHLASWQRLQGNHDIVGIDLVHGAKTTSLKRGSG
jgi:hypothetical protein